LEGHSDDEVLRKLGDLGASRIELLAPGYITARVTINCIQNMQDIVRVSLKGEKEPLRTTAPPQY
jgi:hypothetical protein